MSKTDAPQENITPAVVFTMPWRVKQVRALPDFQIEILFVDGKIGVYDCKHLIFADEPGVFKALQDESEFRAVEVSYGTVAWPCGVDLAPEALYEILFSEHKNV